MVQPMSFDNLDTPVSSGYGRKSVRMAANQERYSLSKLHVRKEEKPLAELYQIGRVLGQGAFGLVRECVSNVTHQKVALKQITLQGKGAEVVAEAVKEVEIMMQLRCDDESSCAMVKIYDCFIVGVDEYLFLVMECIEGGDGETLKASLARDFKLNWKSAMRSFCLALMPVFYSLREIHEKKALHRDIKPANLLFDKVRGRILLSDFGLACMRKNCTGIAGTPAYMDPRSLQCQILDIWSDIYSLGVTLWEMVTGGLYMHAFLVPSGQMVEYHKNKMTQLDPILQQYTESDPEAIIIFCIKLMSIPFNHLKRPSLQSILEAASGKSRKLLRHEGDTEFTDAAQVCALTKAQ